MLITFLEYSVLLSGVVYMVLQILQKQAMWPVLGFSAAAAFAVAVMTHVWANAVVNLYTFIMAVTGLLSWRKFRDAPKTIHLVKLPLRDAVIGIVMVAAVSAALIFVLPLTNDPAPVTDAFAFAFSMLATWWLTRSYLEQWLVWMVADALIASIFFGQQLWGMTILYSFYALSSVFGFFYWKKKGVYRP